jgi:hypothetical protein
LEPATNCNLVRTISTATSAQTTEDNREFLKVKVLRQLLGAESGDATIVAEPTAQVDEARIATA